MAVNSNLGYLLQQGSKGNPANGLDQLRYAVLADGIPSNNEGMVLRTCILGELMTNKLYSLNYEFTSGSSFLERLHYQQIATLTLFDKEHHLRMQRSETTPSAHLRQIHSSAGESQKTA